MSEGMHASVVQPGKGTQSTPAGTVRPPCDGWIGSGGDRGGRWPGER